MSPDPGQTLPESQGDEADFDGLVLGTCPFLEDHPYCLEGQGLLGSGGPVTTL